MRDVQPYPTPAAGSYQANPTASENSQVVSQLVHLEAMIDRLKNLSSEVAQRLCTVLISEPPETKGQSEISLVMVPLADRLRKLVVGVETAGRTLESIIDRIQL